MAINLHITPQRIRRYHIPAGSHGEKVLLALSLLIHWVTVEQFVDSYVYIPSVDP